MKILYMRLKNFKAITAALGNKEIEIDFTKMKNKVLLLLGDNGTCKTFILSNMHPFAHLGNVDIRNSSDIILDNVDGEKEIHFKHGEVIYKINHHYQYQKKGRKISSYISKDGIELNPAGLVSSFNQTIEIEFGIDIGFLRIIRLGSNVNNLIKLKSTERKEFIGKLLSDIEEYDRDYKEASELVKHTTSVMKSLSDKIKRLNVSDPIFLSDSVVSMQEKLIELTSMKENEIRSMGEYRGNVNAVLEEGIDKITEEIEKANLNIRECIKKVSSYSSDIRNIIGYTFTDNINNTKELDIVNRELDKIKDMYHQKQNKAIQLSSIIVDKEKSLMDVRSKLKSYGNFTSIKDIEDRISLCKNSLKEREKIVKTYVPKCTKEDILEDAAVMQSIECAVKTSWEFSDSARDLYLKFQGKKESVKNKCYSRLIKLNNELSIGDHYEKLQEEITVVAPFECELYKKCYAFKQVLKATNSRSRKVIESEIEVTKECIALSDNISKIKTIMGLRKNNFPYIIEVDNIITDIFDLKITFWDEVELTNHIKLIELFNEITSFKDELVNLETEYEYIKREKANIYDVLVSDEDAIIKELSKLNKELNEVNGEINKVNVIKTEKSNYRDALLLNIKLSDTLKMEKENREIIERRKSSIEIINNLNIREEEHDRRVSIINSKYRECEIELNKRKAILVEFHRLSEEKEELNSKFEKYVLLQKAVSKSKGIPLIHINKYLKRTQIEANKIIESIYGNSLRLETFVIDENEFSIPYVKNDMLVNDISLASQGESSIISIALTISLISQFGADYDVLLLDEVDGALDSESKPKFVRILEDFNCEQIIVITHNPLYENYPIDAFITKSRDNIADSFKRINVIN